MSQITKKALAEAFEYLLDVKPLSKITVSDITDRAGVNRHTFYYHFNNINDMISWGISNIVDRLLVGGISYNNWQQAFSLLLQECVKRRKEILAIYHSDFKEYVLRLLDERIYELLRRVIEEQSATMHVSDSDMDYIARFYQYAFVGILDNWLDSGMMEEPDFMMKRLSLLAEGDLKDALQRFDNASANKNKI